MIYLYDNAIVEDLAESFDSDSQENPVVRVIGPDQIIGIAAQIQNDEISFPLVAISRDTPIEIDQSRMNYTRAHKGVPVTIDNDTNQIFYERAIPINLSYKMTVLTTNQADMDEMLRELWFKYLSMYYLTIKLPYEGQRYVRFGVAIDQRSSIEQSSGAVEYIESGQLYQAIIPLYCEGCVEVTYTPRHLTRLKPYIGLADPRPKN